MRKKNKAVLALIITLVIVILPLMGILTSCQHTEVVATHAGIGFVRFEDSNVLALNKRGDK